MKIGKLLELLREVSAYGRLLDRLAHDGARALVLDEAKPYLVAALASHLRCPLLVVTVRPEDSRKLAEQVSAWLGGRTVRLMPEPDALPYQRVSPDSSTELEKIQVLSALSHREINTEPPLVIASTPALSQKLPDARVFHEAWLHLKLGMENEPLRLMDELHKIGYSVESLVEVPGQVSRRGGIVDIFPPTADMPVRLEFFGNTIDSLRLFESVSQHR